MSMEILSLPINKIRIPYFYESETSCEYLNNQTLDIRRT